MRESLDRVHHIVHRQGIELFDATDGDVRRFGAVTARDEIDRDFPRAENKPPNVVRVLERFLIFDHLHPSSFRQLARRG